MGSGKSAMAISEGYEANKHGQKTALLLKSTIDGKGGKFVISRLGIKKEVDFLIKPEKGFLYKKLKNILRAAKGKIRKIIIDEAQFLTENNVQELVEIVEEFEVIASCYSLQSDFCGKMFSGTIVLLPFAVRLIQLESQPISPTDGEIAIMNVRYKKGKVTFEGDQIAIDEAGKKKPVFTYTSESVGEFQRLKKQWEKKNKKIKN